MSESINHFYEFGPFRIDPIKRRLMRDGAIISLTPKAFETLLALVEHNGEIVEKDELMERVWRGVAVEENNLTQNISALRKALGEKREDPEYILTVPGIGYRFIGVVRDLDSKGHFSRMSAGPTPADLASDSIRNSVKDENLIDTRSAWRRPKTLIAAALVISIGLAGVTYRVAKRVNGATSPSNSQIKSIAILPFKPLAAGETDEYLGLGMADALIAKLSSLKQIKVRPTSSIAKYANSDVDPISAGKALDVNDLLDGRVQKIGDRIRVTVQLIRASDGTPLWAAKVDEKYTDLFSVEDRISEEVAAALIPTLTGEQKQQLTRHYTDNADAYQSYIKGRYFWNQRTSESIKKAISYYTDAIIQDPNYALAYAGLADSYTTLGILDDLSSAEMMPKARSAALKALDLDEGLAEAHASLGYVKHRFEWDWPAAEKEFRRAIDLNPEYATAHQWYGWYLVTVGSFDSAEEEFERARQIEPVSLYTNLTLAAAYFYSQRYEKASAQLAKVVEMDPNFGPAHRWLAKTLEQTGKYDEAILEAQKVIRVGGPKGASQAGLAYAYAIAGKQSEARQVLAQLRRTSKDQYVSPYSMATIYAGLGEKDHAFESLEKDFLEHDNSLVFLAVDQQLINLRADPRFSELVKKIGIRVESSKYR